MKKMFCKLVVLSICSVIINTAFAQSSTWDIDSKSAVLKAKYVFLKYARCESTRSELSQLDFLIEVKGLMMEQD